MLPLLRMAACLLCVWFSTAAALADCAAEVAAAWKRLQTSGPYAFTSRSGSEALEITGTVAATWPSGLRVQAVGPGSRYELMVVGTREWTLSQDRWTSVPLDVHAESKVHALARLMGFAASDIAKGMREATCLGRVTKDGRDYLVYEYAVNRSGGALVSREKLLVDATTGFAARQEVAWHLGDEAHTLDPVAHSATDFRLDATLTLEPPASAMAGCASEVVAAFRQLHASVPFAFDVRDTKGTHIPGALDGKGSLKIGSQIFIGPRQWTWHMGWSPGGTWGGTSQYAIRFYGAMLGFDVEHIAKGIDPATCIAGHTTKDGQDLLTYDYHVTKWFMSPYIDHEKLYVDAGSGVPVQQEMQGRRVNEKRPYAPKDIPNRVVTFRLDPSLAIEPPRPQ